MSLLQRTMWSFTSTIGIQMIGLVVNIILARLLYPEIFGLLGMATVLTGFVLVFQEAGMSSYIIYKQQSNRQILATTFWLNVSISFVLAAGIVILSGSIADFYNEQDLTVILKFLALGLFFGSLGITSRAILMQKSQFKRIAVVDLTAELATSVIAIGCALYGYELLAITSRLLFRPMLQSIVFLGMNGRRVLGAMRLSYIKEIIPYSTRILGSQVFIYLNNNVDYLLIGKLLGSKNLGLYTMAFQWSVIARMYISGAVYRVAFPLISEKEGRIDEVRSIYLGIVSKLAFVTFPICIGLIAVAPEFVQAVYGTQWIEALPVLRILLIAGTITSIVTVGGAVFNGLGRPEIDMRINLVSFGAAVGITYGMSRFGLTAIGWGVLLKVLLFDTLKIWYVLKLTKLAASVYVKRLLPCLGAALLMGAAITMTRYALAGLPPLAVLVILVAEGMIVYAALSYWLNRGTVAWVLHKVQAKVPFAKRVARKSEMAN